MHIPDGFLDAKTLVVTNLFSLGWLYVAVKKVNRHFAAQKIPLMGVLASFVFVAQMLAFPVIGGTSAHITGAVLLAVILGPYSGLVIMATILLLQALLFQHGGILTFGANLLNLGIIGGLLGYAIYSIRRSFLSASLAAFFTVVLGAICAALELAFSGRLPLRVAVLSMGGANMIVGIIEGFVTFAILQVIEKVRPDLLELSAV